MASVKFIIISVPITIIWLCFQVPSDLRTILFDFIFKINISFSLSSKNKIIQEFNVSNTIKFIDLEDLAPNMKIFS
jgi:hypothetical protein